MRGLVTDLFLSLPPILDETPDTTPAPLKLGEILASTVITLMYKDDSHPQNETPTNETPTNNETTTNSETHDETHNETPLNETSTTQNTLNKPPQIETPLTETPLASLDASVGGLAGPKRALQQLLAASLLHADAFLSRGIRPPRGILLFGPPGTGKTLLVRSLVSTFRLSFFTSNLALLLSHHAGESERQLASLFARARHAAPAVIFLDEIDALCPPRESVGPATARLCSLLLSLFDQLTERVVVIGATNRWARPFRMRRRPRGLDPALRRPGRFDREVEVEVPTASEKRSILEVGFGGEGEAKILLRDVPNALDAANRDYIADHSNGFTGADLRLLLTEATLYRLDQLQTDHHDHDETGGVPQL